jgi:hypothetical protein
MRQGTCLLLGLLLVGCAHSPSSSFPSPSPTAISREGHAQPTVSPPAESPTPSCASQIISVSETAASPLAWSEEGDELYFFMQRSYQPGWTFSIVDMTSNPTAAEFATPTPHLPQSLLLGLEHSDHLARYAISANGELAVFSVPVYTEATPTPEAEGEGRPPQYVNAIYVLSPADALPIRVGTIRGTVEDIMWLPDDTGAVVRMEHRLSPPPIYAWLVRLSTYTVEPFLEEGVSVYGVSPDGRFALYYLHDEVHIFDFAARSSRGVPSLSGLVYFWWIDNGSRLLFLAPGKAPQYLDTPLVYDLSSGQVLGPVGLGIRVYPWYLPSAILSPDGSMIAFSEDPSQALRIVTLCLAE